MDPVPRKFTQQQDINSVFMTDVQIEDIQRERIEVSKSQVPKQSRLPTKKAQPGHHRTSQLKISTDKPSMHRPFNNKSSQNLSPHSKHH